MDIVKVPFGDIKLQYNSIKEEIDEAIQSVVDETAFISGKYVKEFCENYSKHYGVKHVIPVANGTDAIYIALRMLNIAEGDEVITTACTWISTVETISQAGATPVLIDINDQNLIDENLIEKFITERTKAIIPVHLFGQMCNMEKIRSICDTHELFLIEDCAQSHYAELNGHKAGLTGDVGTFSFYPGKNLGAYGDAGCIVTNNDALAAKMNMFANHGAKIKHQHRMAGINSRMDGIQGAVLNVKLKYIDDWTQKRIDHANSYRALLRDVSNITLPTLSEGTNKHVYHLFVIECDRRTELQEYLKSKGIGTGIHYPVPIPFMEAFEELNYNEEDFPVASRKQSRILSLPMFPELTESQIKFVCESIKEFYN